MFIEKFLICSNICRKPEEVHRNNNPAKNMSIAEYNSSIFVKRAQTE